MLTFKYCIILLFDDKVNYKSKYHVCKINTESKVYNIKYFPLLSQKRDRVREKQRMCRERKPMRKPMKKY